MRAIPPTHGVRRRKFAHACSSFRIETLPAAHRRYARRHGYDLKFYQLQGQGCAHYKCGAGCSHEQYGPRHASYCKVVGLGDALNGGHDWVVFLDSDAFIANASLPLPELISSFGGDLKGNRDDADGSAHGFFGWDWPYTLGPNMGFIALRNTLPMRSLVRDWWNLHPGSFSNSHPYEQHNLHWGLMHMRRFRRRLQTLRLITMDPAAGANAVAHLDHTAGTRNRLWAMVGAAADWLCNPPDGEHCTSKVRESLETLQQPRANWSGWHHARRNKLLRRVVLRVCAEFNASGPHAPPILFNATAVAASSMRQTRRPPPSDLIGSPLQLVNCSRAGPLAAWQTWDLLRRCRQEPRCLNPAPPGVAPEQSCHGMCALLGTGGWSAPPATHASVVEVGASSMSCLCGPRARAASVCSLGRHAPLGSPTRCSLSSACVSRGSGSQTAPATTRFASRCCAASST